ncbi:MAG: hypothetical protein JWP44_4548 [Mucilaginibacter sp.]|nr:hypothetical protein [Mucilaginibacter sp.]
MSAADELVRTTVGEDLPAEMSLSTHSSYEECYPSLNVPPRVLILSSDTKEGIEIWMDMPVYIWVTHNSSVLFGPARYVLSSVFW